MVKTTSLVTIAPIDLANIILSERMVGRVARLLYDISAGRSKENK
jgi:hypothetical protein